MPTHWPDPVDEILGGDQAVALAYVTPAGGVVVSPVTNFALRDREAGTVTVNSSVGASRKLERIRSNPNVALAYHSRRHGRSDRPEYVLVQGTASLSAPRPGYPATIREHWERAVGPIETGAFWDRWLRVYHLRVGIAVAVTRVLVWPTLECRGEPAVHGAPLCDRSPGPQSPPRLGTGPRIDHERAARRAGRLPHALLGWVGADGLPVVLPVAIGPPDARGIALEVRGDLAPAGGRRAGLTAHAFTRHVLGQEQRVHTGWLGGCGVYAPHTETGYRLPPSRLLFHLAVGFETRRRAPRPDR